MNFDSAVSFMRLSCLSLLFSSSDDDYSLRALYTFLLLFLSLFRSSSLCRDAWSRDAFAIWRFRVSDIVNSSSELSVSVSEYSCFFFFFLFAGNSTLIVLNSYSLDPNYNEGSTLFRL